MIRDHVDLFSDDHWDSNLQPNFAYLLAPAILLDSANFAPTLKDNKWSQEDIEAHSWLS